LSFLLLRVPGALTISVETEFPGHAANVTYTLDVQNVDCIVCIGGDGLLFEVVNALLTRSDELIARRLPLAVIPCG